MMQVIRDENAILLPVVEVGNLGKEYLDQIYYTKSGDKDLVLYPLLSLRKSLQEMYSGDSEYANRLFYLAHQLPEDFIAQHVDKIITAKDIPAYLLSKKVKESSINKLS